MIGSVIDKYEVLEKVGEGGMATVYLGKHVTLGRVVAIKVLHPHLSASTRNRLRFEREARAIEHLDHENILEIYDYSGRDVQDCYIVTEFVKGRTLHAVISERGLVPSEVAAMIGLKLASALAYAHHAGIIHRDLKPENVMLSDDGTVKLMDFGIARFLDETTVTMTGALVGSPAYMSPEQALERTVDARSDLFSLGSLLFHLVTGRLPFSGSNPSIILRNIIESRRAEVLELQPAASARLADVIERLLQTNPEGRFEDAVQVCEALRAVLTEAGLGPESPSWSLVAYLEDADDYEQRLAAHLDVRLLDEGRAAFAQGDHLGAQRMFNRLLARHPEHPEVLEILANAQFPEVIDRPGERDRSPWLTGGLVVLGALVAVGAWWLLKPEPPAEPVVEETVVEEPVVEEQPELEVSAVEVEEPVEEPVEEEAPEERTAVRRAVEVPVVAEVEPIEEEPVEEAPPVAVPGVLQLKLGHAGFGDVMINGEDRGDIASGRPLELDLAPGEYEVTVNNEWSYDFVQSVMVTEGETTSVRVLLRRKPLTLSYGSLEPDCEVFVDGTRRGTVASTHGQLNLEVAKRSLSGVARFDCADGELEFPFSGAPGATVELPR